MVFFLTGFPCVFAVGNRESARGNGDETTSEQALAFFDRIEITHDYNIRGGDGTGTIRVHSDQRYRASIRIDSNLNQHVEIANEGGKLNIRVKRRISEDFTVDVYCPNILGIAIDSAGQVEFVDKMITPSLEVSIAGAGTIRGAVECDSFSANSSGAGSVEISGSSREARVKISGAGSFNGYEFRVNNGTFEIDGAGSVECWVTDNLTASISGIGSVKYRGDPLVDAKHSGLGAVRKAD
jgi:hypothetical protein